MFTCRSFRTGVSRKTKSFFFQKALDEKCLKSSFRVSAALSKMGMPSIDLGYFLGLRVVQDNVTSIPPFVFELWRIFGRGPPGKARVKDKFKCTLESSLQ